MEREGKIGSALLTTSAKRDMFPPLYVSMGFMALVTAMVWSLVTAMVWSARSQDSALAVSVRRVHVVFSTAGFKSGGKPSPKTRDTNALRRGIRKASNT